jgi:hypothetical protein
MNARQRKKDSPEMQAVQLRHAIAAYEQEREFLEDYGEMDIASLHQAANEMSILATKLQALAWQRQDELITAN